jgi:hypothetical protein
MKHHKDYYYTLWDSLTTDELLSMRKSNIFSKDLLSHYKHYLISRSIIEMIPLMLTVAITSFIINFLVKEKIMRSDKK